MNRVFLTLALFLFLAHTATAQTTNGLSDAEIKGQQLAKKLCEMQPTENSTNSGVLEIRGKGTNVTYPIKFETFVSDSNWLIRYIVTYKRHGAEMVLIAFGEQGFVLYDEKSATDFDNTNDSPTGKELINMHEIMSPFAGSDFWVADLSLVFFHWPGQKVLKHETRRTRACMVLESTNPDPSPDGYSHVDSWIDDETLGIVHAEAYDVSGKLLKVFDPKSFKKVNGQWELQDMEIRNVQAGSRTWIKFDLNNKS